MKNNLLENKNFRIAVIAATIIALALIAKGFHGKVVKGDTTVEITTSGQVTNSVEKATSKTIGNVAK